MNINELLENLEKFSKKVLIAVIKKQQYSLKNMKTGFDDTIGKLETINREYMELLVEFDELQKKYTTLEEELEEVLSKNQELSDRLRSVEEA